MTQKELNEQLETMCRRCENHEVCLGTGCTPKQELYKLINEAPAQNKVSQLALFGMLVNEVCTVGSKATSQGEYLGGIKAILSIAEKVLTVDQMKSYKTWFDKNEDGIKNPKLKDNQLSLFDL